MTEQDCKKENEKLQKLLWKMRQTSIEGKQSSSGEIFNLIEEGIGKEAIQAKLREINGLPPKELPDRYKVIDIVNNITKRFKTLQEAKSSVVNCLSNDAKYHEIGNDIVIEYYFVTIAIIREIKDE